MTMPTRSQQGCRDIPDWDVGEPEELTMEARDELGFWHDLMTDEVESATAFLCSSIGGTRSEVR